MAYLVPKQLLGVVQILVLLLSSFTVLGYNEDYAQAPHNIGGYPPVGAPKADTSRRHHHHHHHHHHHLHPHLPRQPVSLPPVQAPTQPPVKTPSPPAKSPTSPPPSKPPTQPPVKPPTPRPSPLRKFVDVQGVVYCKSCKYGGIDTLLEAAPLAGAMVRLFCNNTKYHLAEDAKTDKNGYFFIMPQKLTTDGAHKCKVYLLSSPEATCNVTTDLHAGRKGAILMPTLKASPPKPTVQLFTVGPFAFEPSKKLPCKH